MDRLVKSEANAERIAAVENCFGGSGQSLAIPGRVLIGEGVLTKMCRKKPKPRQFFLFNDILVYGNIVMNKKKYNKQHIIPLEEVMLEDLEDDGALKNGWLIRTLTKSFAVYAATIKEKVEWIAHISKCVANLLEITGKKPTTEHAAVWVPDAEASICMHCRRTQFTLINRRHHCRKCGAVVCGSCSSKKFLLPSQSSKSLRVCLSCYERLSKARCPISNEVAKVTVSQNQNKPVIYDSSGDEDSDEDEQLDKDEQKKMNSGEDEQKLCDANHDVSSDLQTLGLEDKPIFYENGDEEIFVTCVDEVPNKSFSANTVAVIGPSESSVAVTSEY